MTFQSSATAFRPPTDDFTMSRVDYMEAFSRLEAMITSIVLTYRPDFEPRSHFAIKLKALQELQSPSLSKKALARFAGLKEEVTKFVKIRNDMVHGIMSPVNHDGLAKAAFHNAADLALGLPQYTILSLDEMEQDRKRLREIAHQLKQIANPSPPQPSQA
jgi:hypothetical protein